MIDKPHLTERQQQVLDIIENTIATTGSPPTRSEIASILGFKSINAAEDHIQALARKGMIDIVSGVARGIRLKKFDPELNPQSKTMDTILHQISIPLIGKVAAGSPILAHEHVDQHYYLQRSLFHTQPDFLLRVRGPSMRDAGIVDGDLVAVKTSHEAKNGQIVVARFNHEVTIKRFRQHSNHFFLHPENSDFLPITIQEGDHFAIEGIAVGLIRENMH